jgi:large subunit ribosomal protein L18
VYKPANSRAARLRRHARIRRRISGTQSRPRLSVFRSAVHIYAQVIDDTQGRTIVAASTAEADLKKTKGTKSDQAKAVGAEIAKRAKAAGISQVIFDRGGYLYHGRIKALADGAREGGLDF